MTEEQYVYISFQVPTPTRSGLAAVQPPGPGALYANFLLSGVYTFEEIEARVTTEYAREIERNKSSLCAKEST